MFNKYLTRKLAAKACVFVLNSTNYLNCTRTCIPLVRTSLLVPPCLFMCEKHIHCFFLVVAASSNCICWRFRPEMSRGAAHAFLYGVYCNWWFPGTGACPVSIVSCIALIPCHSLSHRTQIRVRFFFHKYRKILEFSKFLIFFNF